VHARIERWCGGKPGERRGCARRLRWKSVPRQFVTSSGGTGHEDSSSVRSARRSYCIMRGLGADLNLHGIPADGNESSQSKRAQKLSSEGLPLRASGAVSFSGRPGLTTRLWWQHVLSSRRRSGRSSR
jgi:hypothetical protein